MLRAGCANASARSDLASIGPIHKAPSSLIKTAFLVSIDLQERGLAECLQVQLHKKRRRRPGRFQREPYAGLCTQTPVSFQSISERVYAGSGSPVFNLETG